MRPRAGRVFVRAWGPVTLWAFAWTGCGVPQDGVETSPLSAPVGAHLNYYGGRVVSNAQVVQVIYGTGSYLPEVTSTGSPSLATFYQGVLNSGFVDWLAEYDTTTQAPPSTNQIIGRGSFASQVVITPSAANNGATIDDTNIQNELALQLQAGTLPAPTHDAAGNNNTYYAIFFPHGKGITRGGSTEASCVRFCAYHGTIANAGGHGEIYYGVHPDLQAGSGCESWCGMAPTTFGNYTQIASHELVETLTDAEVGIARALASPIGWYDTNYHEIADICGDQAGTVVGADGVTYNVQRAFSNFANDCIVSRSLDLQLNPLAFEGGTPATGTVSLDAIAPAGGIPVTLASSLPALVTVPGSVLVPAGSMTATFPITSNPTATDVAVTVTATFPTATRSGSLTVLASPQLASLVLAPTAVGGGNASVATVTLTGPAPTGGAVVTVTSDAPAVATVPATVVIPVGSWIATFAVATAPQTSFGSATISASYRNKTRTAQLTTMPVVGPPMNQPPVVNAGPDETVMLPGAATLTSTVTDDGLPNPPALLTTTWSMVSGPGTTTFGNAATAITSATFSTAGTYVLRLTGTDGALSASDDVVLTVTPAPPGNRPPVVNAGPDQTITLPAVVSLAGVATDDGLPNPPGALAVDWSVVDCLSATFAHASALDTTVTILAAGPCVLRLTASDGVLTTSDDIVITVNPTPEPPPPASGGPHLTVTLPPSLLCPAPRVATGSAPFWKSRRLSGQWSAESGRLCSPERAQAVVPRSSLWPAPTR